MSRRFHNLSETCIVLNKTRNPYRRSGQQSSARTAFGSSRPQRLICSSRRAYIPTAVAASAISSYNTPELANTQASSSKQAPQLSPRAALPALCQCAENAINFYFSLPRKKQKLAASWCKQVYRSLKTLRAQG